MEFDALDTY